MIKLLSSVLRSSTTASVIKGGHAGLSKAMPPVAFGGSLAAGIVSMVVSGYKIVDCFRYQTGPGQCDSVIETNLPGVVAGSGVLAGCWGAFNTYNPKLRKDEKPGEVVKNKLVISDPPDLTEEKLMKEIQKMRTEKATQKEMSEALGISRYEVRKMIRKIRLEERGR
jgi:hypothetical protein